MCLCKLSGVDTWTHGPVSGVDTLTTHNKATHRSYTNTNTPHTCCLHMSLIVQPNLFAFTSRSPGFCSSHSTLLHSPHLNSRQDCSMLKYPQAHRLLLSPTLFPQPKSLSSSTPSQHRSTRCLTANNAPQRGPPPQDELRRAGRDRSSSLPAQSERGIRRVLFPNPVSTPIPQPRASLAFHLRRAPCSRNSRKAFVNTCTTRDWQSPMCQLTLVGQSPILTS